MENVIREIREAQADRQRTREVRDELSAYREEIATAEQQAKEDMISRKMRQLEERRKRKEERRNKKSNAPAAEGNAAETACALHSKEIKITPSMATGGTIGVGSSVRIKGQNAVGTVDEINGTRASVLFGMMRTLVDVKKLEAAKESPKPTIKAAEPVQSRNTGTGYMHKASLQFSQEIDIRGMRADEALQTIMYYVDDAILVGAHRVRILHGTGTGALRQLVRQYLNTIPQVASARDEHVQFGGAGITVVEFAY